MKLIRKLHEFGNTLGSSDPSSELGSFWEAEPLTGPMVIAVDPDATEYTVDEATAREHYTKIARLAINELSSRDLAEDIRRASSSTRTD